MSVFAGEPATASITDELVGTTATQGASARSPDTATLETSAEAAPSAVEQNEPQPTAERSSHSQASPANTPPHTPRNGPTSQAKGSPFDSLPSPARSGHTSPQRSMSPLRPHRMEGQQSVASCRSERAASPRMPVVDTLVSPQQLTFQAGKQAVTSPRGAASVMARTTMAAQAKERPLVSKQLSKRFQPPPPEEPDDSTSGERNECMH